MITRIQFLRSIGQFEYVVADAIGLDRFVLIYAENGRGKTTLAAILRSLATGDPLPIRERRRLAAPTAPHAVLYCSDTHDPAVFENGAWSRTSPNMVIFDDRFVDENVYSGLGVEPAHRQNLHELVIGAQGVDLNRQLQALVQQIEEHNANLRVRAAGIPTAIRGTFSVDEFCDLPELEEVDRDIQAAERNLAAAQQQRAVHETPAFDLIELSAFDIAAVTRTLELDLPGLDAAAAFEVQEHFLELGDEGEAWVADGMQRIGRGDGDNETCPFCTQDLAQSAVIGHYREYFGQAYTQLKEHISETLVQVRELHPRDLPGRLERGVRIAAQRAQFWSNFCDIPQIALETETLMHDWQTSRDGLIAALEAKQAAPLDRIELPERVQAAIESFADGRVVLATFNEHLQEANNAIAAVKQRAALGDPQAAAGSLARLKAIRSRHANEVSRLCDEYMTERAAKSVTEGSRDRTQGELERYREAEFPNYQIALNAYLSRFSAGFRVGRVTPADTRGGPACNYEVLINDVPIPISGAVPGPGEPAFRNTLSSGDRSTLALAFFLASIDRNQNLANTVVVIDDPVSSLDEHRSLTTVQELRRLGGRAGQVIVLSHDNEMVCGVWQGIDRTHCTALKIQRHGDGSDIIPWDVTADCVTENDRNHGLLASYLETGPRNNSREAAAALRPVVEAFLRVAYSAHFPPTPGAMRQFRGLCRQNLGTNAEILDAQDTSELDELAEYANLFHHNTNVRCEHVVINDGQLRGFVERTLRFCRR